MLFRMSRTSIRLMLDEGFRDYRYYKEKGWFESDYYNGLRHSDPEPNNGTGKPACTQKSACWHFFFRAGVLYQKMAPFLEDLVKDW